MISGACASAPAEEGQTDSGAHVAKAGDSCGGLYSTQGSECANPKLLLECRTGDDFGVTGGVLREVPCRAPIGCTTTSTGGSVCDNTVGVLERDGCMQQQESKALCSDDAGTRFQCLDGGFVGTHCDGGCSSAGGSVYCN